MIDDDKKPIYVAVNGSGICVGYAFCQLQEQSVSNNTVPFKSLYVDDLCVDKEQRGKHIGEALFDYVKKRQKDGLLRSNTECMDREHSGRKIL